VEVLRISLEGEVFVPGPREEVRDGVEGTVVPVALSDRLSAAEKWFKANGYYTPKEKSSGAISAEDIVKEMLAQTREGESTKLSIEVTKGEGSSP
jgi:hypothetical protein